MGCDELIATLRKYLPDIELPANYSGPPREVIAGSFPLYFVYQSVDPRLWHRSTRGEILLLAWISKLLLDGRSLPMPALERIGHCLQVAPFDEDFRSGAVDIDLISSHDLLPFLPGEHWFAVSVHLREFLPKIEDKSRGWYFLMEPNIERTVLRLPNVRPSVDSLILRDQDILPWIEDSFDFEFCNVVFDGRTLKASPDTTAMRGAANLAKYRRMWRRLELGAFERDWIPRVHGGKGQLSAQEIKETVGAKLADLMQARLDKYNRRRFTVTNEKELRQLIAEVRAWSSMVSRRDNSPKRPILKQ